MNKVIVCVLLFFGLVSATSAQDLIMKTGFEVGELLPNTVQILPVAQPTVIVSQGHVDVVLYRGRIRNALTVQFNLNQLGLVVNSSGPFPTNPFQNFRLVFRPSNYVVNLTTACVEFTCVNFSQPGMVGMAPMVDQDFEVIANVGNTAGFIGYNYGLVIYSIAGQSIPTTAFGFSGLPGTTSSVIIQ